MPFIGAQEDDGVIACRSGRHSRQVSLERQDRGSAHRLLAAQGRVHVETAEILADRLQLLQAGRNRSTLVSRVLARMKINLHVRINIYILDFNRDFSCSPKSALERSLPQYVFLAGRCVRRRRRRHVVRSRNARAGKGYYTFF